MPTFLMFSARSVWALGSKRRRLLPLALIRPTSMSRDSTTAAGELTDVAAEAGAALGGSATVSRPAPPPRERACWRPWARDQ